MKRKNKFIEILLKPFFFKKTHIDLKNKWWHRLFVVILVLFIILLFVFSLALYYEVIPHNKSNVNITNNLREFTKNSSKSVANTIPMFVVDSRIGCLKNDNSIEYLSAYALQTSVCSSDLRGNINEVAEIIIEKNSFKETQKQIIIDDLNKKLDKDIETRYCFIHSDVSCDSSDRIISYKNGVLFYLEVLLASIFSVYFIALFLQLVYFKGFIYIIYGKKNDKYI